jgi:hypothetical protein
MMGLSSRQVQAYHRQIGRLRAANDMRLLRIIRAPHLKPDAQNDLWRELQQEARGTPEKTITVSNNEELKHLLRRQ